MGLDPQEGNKKIMKFLVGIFHNGKPEDVKEIDFPEEGIGILDSIVGFISKDIPTINGRFYAFDYKHNHMKVTRGG